MAQRSPQALPTPSFRLLTSVTATMTASTYLTSPDGVVLHSRTQFLTSEIALTVLGYFVYHTPHTNQDMQHIYSELCGGFPDVDVGQDDISGSNCAKAKKAKSRIETSSMELYRVRNRYRRKIRTLTTVRRDNSISTTTPTFSTAPRPSGQPCPSQSSASS